MVSRLVRFIAATILVGVLAISLPVEKFGQQPPVPVARADSGTFSNSASIAIPKSGTSGVASSYPSSIAVSDLAGVVTSVTVTLNSLSHDRPDDLDILLVGPDGTRIILMSDSGGSDTIGDVSLTFVQATASSLPNSGQIVAGTFRPSNSGSGDAWTGSAPGGPYGSSLNSFIGTNPNGTWRLFIVDDSSGDTGSLSGGWSLTIQSEIPPTSTPTQGTLFISAPGGGGPGGGGPGGGGPGGGGPGGGGPGGGGPGGGGPGGGGPGGGGPGGGGPGGGGPGGGGPGGGGPGGGHGNDNEYCPRSSSFQDSRLSGNSNRNHNDNRRDDDDGECDDNRNDNHHHGSPTATPTAALSPTATPTATASPTVAESPTATPTNTATATPTVALSPTATPTNTATATPTIAATVSGPIDTPTPTVTPTIAVTVLAPPSTTPTATATPIIPPVQDEYDGDNSTRPRTEEQRQQQQQTNRSNRSDVVTEGNVLAVRVGPDGLTITIGNVDGEVIIHLACTLDCPSVQVGNYIEVDGEKIHEQLYEAEYITVVR